jgi:hypothetical protein
MTILGGDYEPVEVKTLDLVGYKGDGVFVILNPIKSRGRKLPGTNDGILEGMPLCIRAKIENNQVVNFSGEAATLNNIDGVWYYKFRNKPGSQLRELEPHNFFEIGDSR